MTTTAAGDTAAERVPATARQDGFAYRFDWGASGLRALAPVSDVVIVVDVFTFGTAASLAVDAGATVLPHRRADDGRERATAVGAMLVAPPAPLADLLAGPIDRHVVLADATASALVVSAAEAGAGHVLVGCLRNASATAGMARRLAGDNGVVSIIAAGERWNGRTGPLRPAVEDLLAAGAILTALDPADAVSAPRCSPEAAIARHGFTGVRHRIVEAVECSATGREFLAHGAGADVLAAAALDVSQQVVRLDGDRLVGR